MSNKHRSAQGKIVDMSVLAKMHEKTRAVGNMNINARGDILNNMNEIVNDTTNRVKAQYRNIVNQQPRHQPAPPANRNFQQASADLAVPVTVPVVEEVVEETLSIEELELEKELNEEIVPEKPKKASKDDKTGV